MQLRDLYLKGKNKLLHEGFETPGIEIKSLLSKALGIKPHEIYSNPERFVNLEELYLYEKLVERRVNNEPSSYVTGSREFYSIDFLVDPRVLIPRPETELLVEESLKFIPRKGNFTVADIGTGSGCVGITLSLLRPNIFVVATDISKDALAVAKKNCSRNGVEERIGLIGTNILSCFKENAFDMILSNPPYISSPDYDNLPIEIKGFEPKIALLAEDNGLDCIKKIVFQAKKTLKNKGLCMIEVGRGQSMEVMDLFSINGFVNISSISDLNGTERVVKAQWKK